MLRESIESFRKCLPRLAAIPRTEGVREPRRHRRQSLAKSAFSSVAIAQHAAGWVFVHCLLTLKLVARAAEGIPGQDRRRRLTSLGPPVTSYLRSPGLATSDPQSVRSTVTEPLAHVNSACTTTQMQEAYHSRGAGILPRRRPGIVGFRRRGLPGGPRGRRSTGCGLVRGELLLDVGRLVGELLPAAGCGKDMVTVSLDDQDPYFASPSVSVGSGKPKVSSAVRPGCRVEVLGSGSVAT